MDEKDYTMVFGYEVPKDVSMNAVSLLKVLSQDGAIILWDTDLNPDLHKELSDISTNIGLLFKPLIDGSYVLIDGFKVKNINFKTTI